MPRRNSKKSSDSELDSYEENSDFGQGADHSKARLQQLFRDILGRWYWIALCLAVGVLGGFYYLSKAPEEYSATSSLLIKQRASSVMSSETPDDLDPRDGDSMNTIAQRATRIELMTKVADRPDVKNLENLLPVKTNWWPEWSHQWMGMEEDEEATDASSIKSTDLGMRIASWTTARVRMGTRLLDITVAHHDPEVCKVIADAIANEYVAELGGVRADDRQSNANILAAKSEEEGAKLANRTEALANYQGAINALQQLEAREIAFREIDRRYKPKHPDHIKASATLADFQRRFLAEFVDVRKALVDQEYWEGSRAEWDQPDLDPDAQLQISRRLLSARATVLAGQVSSLKSLHNSMLESLMTLDVNKGVIEASLELNNLARRPWGPISPKSSSVLMKASMGGLAAGLLLALLLSKLDTKLHSVLQAELLTDLPVLATINNLEPKIFKKIIKAKGVDQEEENPDTKLWDRRITFRGGLSDTVYAESFRILRASVALLGDEEARKITLFTSALPGEGKTLTSTNFAIASAQQGKKTLLIDLDLRKPALHRSFGLKRSELVSGVTELLAGKVSLEEACTSMDGQENLTCLFAGVRAPNPGELLNSDAVGQLFEAAEKYFDVIVVDSAPLLAVPDTRLLVPLVDNFCFVIRAEQTPKAAISKAIGLLKDDGTEPAGIVINGLEQKSGLGYKRYRYGYGGYGQYGKGYGYGSYGSYGSDQEDD